MIPLRAQISPTLVGISSRGSYGAAIGGKQAQRDIDQGVAVENSSQFEPEELVEEPTVTGAPV